MALIIVPEPVKLSEFDRLHVPQIIADPTNQKYTNFSALVIKLIVRADPEQIEVLRRAYPDHVAAVEAWRYQGTGEM